VEKEKRGGDGVRAETSGKETAIRKLVIELGEMGLQWLDHAKSTDGTGTFRRASELRLNGTAEEKKAPGWFRRAAGRWEAKIMGGEKRGGNGTGRTAMSIVRKHYSRSVKPRYIVRFEVSTAVTRKNVVFWDVTPCGSCKNRRFGGT
jgi:hypothetical protein